MRKPKLDGRGHQKCPCAKQGDMQLLPTSDSSEVGENQRRSSTLQLGCRDERPRPTGRKQGKSGPQQSQVGRDTSLCLRLTPTSPAATRRCYGSRFGPMAKCQRDGEQERRSKTDLSCNKRRSSPTLPLKSVLECSVCDWSMDRADFGIGEAISSESVRATVSEGQRLQISFRSAALGGCDTRARVSPFFRAAGPPMAPVSPALFR